MRKVNEESAHNVRARRKKDELELVNEGEPWTRPMIDDLINGFLEGLFYESARECLALKCRRTATALQNQLWKLCTRYPRPSIVTYRPANLSLCRARAGLPWTARDYAVVDLATGVEGRRNGACACEYVAKLLRREPEEVSRTFDALIKKGRKQSLFAGEPNEVGDELAFVKAVNQGVKDAYERARRSAGL